MGEQMTITIRLPRPKWEPYESDDWGECEMCEMGLIPTKWVRYYLTEGNEEERPAGWWLACEEGEYGRPQEITDEWGDAGPYETKEELNQQVAYFCLVPSLGHVTVREVI